MRVQAGGLVAQDRAITFDDDQMHGIIVIGNVGIGPSGEAPGLLQCTELVSKVAYTRRPPFGQKAKGSMMLVMSA